MVEPVKKAAAKKAPAKKAAKAAKKAVAEPELLEEMPVAADATAAEVEARATIAEAAAATPLANPFFVLLEKVLATYVQVFIGVLVVGQAINASTAQAAAIAAIPAALTILANGLPVVPIGLPFYVDLILRTVRTYAVSFIGLLIAQPVFKLDRSAAMAAAVGGIPTALAVVKGGLASKVGQANSAALLPARLDMPASVAAA